MTGIEGLSRQGNVSKSKTRDLERSMNDLIGWLDWKSCGCSMGETRPSSIATRPLDELEILLQIGLHKLGLKVMKVFGMPPAGGLVDGGALIQIGDDP